MISASQFEKLLIAARNHNVYRVEFEDGRPSKIEFFSPVEKKDVVQIDGLRIYPDTTPGGSEAPTSALPDNTVEAQKEMDRLSKTLGDIPEMPSDEDFRFFHSPIVEVENPIPQQELRGEPLAQTSV